MLFFNLNLYSRVFIAIISANSQVQQCDFSNNLSVARQLTKKQLVEMVKADQGIRSKINSANSDQLLVQAVDHENYDQVKLLLASEKSLTPNFLSELLFDTLITSNGPCNPEDLKFSCNIYAIIKLLVERGANLDLEINYLSSGLLGECVDQCGHGTQAVVCSIKQFVFSSDYRVAAVKELFKAKNINI